jgi:hypothetical protein
VVVVVVMMMMMYTPIGPGKLLEYKRYSRRQSKLFEMKNHKPWFNEKFSKLWEHVPKSVLVNIRLMHLLYRMV